MNLYVLDGIVLFCIFLPSVKGVSFPAPTVDNWFAEGQEELKNALERKLNTNVAKNVILFIGDGLDITTTTASRIYAGQKKGNSGEEYKLTYEQLPNVALSKTYNTDRQGPDSAGTATAMMCGVKAAAGTVGVNQNIARGDCSTLEQNKVDSILYLSHKEGKSTGLVTTARITHATPAAAYAHCPDRDFEATVEEDSVPVVQPEKCMDIAQQLIKENPYINVILGGGRRSFFPNGTADEEYPTDISRRKDDLNLVEQWKSEKTTRGVSHEYVWRKEQFDNVASSTEYLLGLFNYGHMQFELDRADDPAGEPSIAEMTEKAIEILSKNKKGYFLMVEGARIDHAHHDSTAQKALADTVAFDEAVKKAIDLTNDEETLIVVTADHSHVFTMGGYAQRGNPILGFVDENHDSEVPSDNMPYLSLMYANGPGYVSPRQNLTNVDTEDKNFIQPSAVGMEDETHGGQDVAIYAQGPLAHLFHGTHEQHYIAHVMMYASCVGPNKKHCDKKTNGAPRFVHNMSVFIIVLLAVAKQFEV